MPEIRKDPVTGRAVIVSVERAKRPEARAPSRESPCPFCAGNERLTPPEVLAYRDIESDSDAAGWSVRVVPNKYPAVIGEDVRPTSRNGPFESAPGIGVHEVIIESPEHVVDAAALGERQLAAVLRCYRERMLDLGRDHRWRSILVYKNQGAPAGATLDHAHSQLIALPETPDQIRAEIDGATRFFESHGRCFHCEMIARTVESGERLVAEYKGWITLSPYAARFPFEILLLPTRHAPRFEGSSDQDLAELAHGLCDALTRLNRALGHPPFNFFIHSLPRHEAKPESYHWHIEILPKLVQVAGFEWGSGMFINPVAPEDAAKRLREIAL